MYINYELYRVFYQVAMSGSITKAAQELFISQPAVSQSIKQLENQIGGRLFLRTGKGMELTPEGRLIFDYIKQANILIEKAEKKFSQLKELSLGEIRIGASDTNTKYFLLRYIKQYMNMYPEIKVKITNRTSKDTLHLLKTGKIDIGFTSCLPDDDSFEAKVCEQRSQVFVANERLIQDIKKPLSAKEIAEKDLIMLEKTSFVREEADKFFEELGVAIEPNLELCSYDLMTDMARLGFGIAYVPRDTVQEELTTGSLFEVPLDFELPKSLIVLVTVKNMPLNFSATEFVKMLPKS